jgi:signal peptidase I
MTESIIANDLQTSEISTIPDKKARRYRPWLAALLSLLSPGLGQVYNEQLFAGFAFTLTAWLAGTLAFFVLLRTFYGLIIFFILIFILYVYGCFNAYKNANQRKMEQASSSVSLAARIGAATLILGFNLGVGSDYVLKHFYPLHAYKVPSASMCPTICEGDRFVADLRSYRATSPKRGEVVLFLFQDEAALHIKRVAAVAGDMVTASNGRLLVNAIPVVAPHSACGSPANQKEDFTVPQEFVPGQVPPNHLFLLGDNEGNSYDSRYYGTVEASRIRGKPLYLFWSRQPERISCIVK